MQRWELMSSQAFNDLIMLFAHAVGNYCFYRIAETRSMLCESVQYFSYFLLNIRYLFNYLVFFHVLLSASRGAIIVESEISLIQPVLNELLQQL